MTRVDNRMKVEDACRLIAKEFKYDEIMGQCESFELPVGWKITVIPPFSRAVLRYTIDSLHNYYSVYLDCEINLLGCVGEAYYEVYDRNLEDCYRFMLNEQKEMLQYMIDNDHEVNEGD